MKHAGYLEGRLEEKGYAVEILEELKAAATSEDYFTRYAALEVLTNRSENDAKPLLKAALDDEHVAVRWRAAHLLGTVGDKSGLGRMRQDYGELAGDGWAATPHDPNIEQNPNKMEEWQRERRYRIRRALEVGRVMAELGDRGAYDLAVSVGLESEQAGLRSRAVDVLAEVARADALILQAEGRDPVSVLCAMAIVEDSPATVGAIRGYALHLGGEDGMRILQAAVDSAAQKEEDKEVARAFLEVLRKRAAKTKE
jgi:hypothetical protein